jgi:hypothetical protein
MNILSMVMGLLLIFACTFGLSLRKAILTQGVEKTYQAHMNASRKIRNSYESLCYSQLRSEIKEKHKEKEEEKERQPSHAKEIKRLNLDCARLNLWPLVIDGAEKHPDLYETAAQLLYTFYSKPLFDGEPRLEYRLLDAIIQAAREVQNEDNNSRLMLEKLILKKQNVKPLYSLPSTYYRMLRGTKNIASDQSYPSLLDYFVLENKQTRICIHHASVEMLVSLFGEKAGSILYNEIHKSEIPLTREHMLDLCAQNGKPGLNEGFLKLLDLDSSAPHCSKHKILVKQDADVCLKQKVFFPG